jgi:hypothetical protein
VTTPPTSDAAADPEVDRLLQIARDPGTLRWATVLARKLAAIREDLAVTWASEEFARALAHPAFDTEHEARRLYAEFLATPPRIDEHEVVWRMWPAHEPNLIEKAVLRWRWGSVPGEDGRESLNQLAAAVEMLFDDDQWPLPGRLPLAMKEAALLRFRRLASG